MLWIRPIVTSGSVTSGSPPGLGYGADRIYNLSINRPRPYIFTHAEARGGTIELALTKTSRRHARIEPATGTELAELQTWDTFFSNVLSPQEQRDLQALHDNSWHGRFG